MIPENLRQFDPDPAGFFIPRLHRDCGQCPETGRILADERHKPVVYFARAGRKIKIGTSTNLQSRLRQMFLELNDVLAVTSGDKSVEAAYHRRFSRSRLPDSRSTELFGSDIWLRLYLARCRLSWSEIAAAGGAGSATAVILPASVGLILGSTTFALIVIGCFMRPGWNWRNGHTAGRETDPVPQAKTG